MMRSNTLLLPPRTRTITCPTYHCSPMPTSRGTIAGNIRAGTLPPHPQPHPHALRSARTCTCTRARNHLLLANGSCGAKAPPPPRTQRYTTKIQPLRTDKSTTLHRQPCTTATLPYNPYIPTNVHTITHYGPHAHGTLILCNAIKLVMC